MRGNERKDFPDPTFVTSVCLSNEFDSRPRGLREIATPSTTYVNVTPTPTISLDKKMDQFYLPSKIAYDINLDQIRIDEIIS